MIRPTIMSIRFSITLSLLISTGLSAIWAPDSSAARIDAPPLPRQREIKGYTPATSGFPRRPDYREAEIIKQKEAEAKKKAAAEAAAKARAEQLQAIKDRSNGALEANNRGVALGGQRRWAEAISAHESAVQQDPGNKQFRINLSAARTAFGQERLQAGDFNSAANLFRKALAATNDNGMASKLLDEAMKKLGRDPKNVDVRLATGDQLSAANDYEGAAIEYQVAMQLEPSARTYLKVGDIAIRYGQISTAMGWYRQAIVKDADYGPAHRQLGLLYYAQKDLTSAASSLRKAVVLDPKDVAAGQMLVEIWRKQVAANPLLAENHLGLAGALQITGDFVGADAEYRRLEALDPKHPGLEPGRASMGRAIQHAKAEKHYAAAVTLFNSGLRREALGEISQATMMEPKNDKYQFLLAEVLETMGDYAGAHQAYLTCVLINPEKNKEAANRMREMQNSTRNMGMNQQQVQQQVQQTVNMFTQPNLPATPPRFMNQMPLPQSVTSTTANVPMQVLGENGSQVQSGLAGMNVNPNAVQIPQMAPAQNGNTIESLTQTPNQGMTQSAPQMMQSAPQSMQAAPQAGMPATPQPANDPLAKVTELEAQKNFAEAIKVLQEMLPANMKNARIHNRLGVNLLASGETTEALAELRMAAMLEPNNKDFAADLARALDKHKKSMASSSSEIAK
jgi:tetratricopeptide (TPR) repeat protein